MLLGFCENTKFFLWWPGELQSRHLSKFLLACSRCWRQRADSPAEQAVVVVRSWKQIWKRCWMWFWLVVSTPLKNISQLGWLFPIHGKIKIFQTTNQDLYVPKQTGQTRTSHQTWYWTWLNLSETKLANKSGIIKSNSKSAAGSPHWQAGDMSYHQTPTIPNTSKYCKSDATSRKPYAFFSDFIAAFNKLRHDGAIENPGVAAWIIQSSTNCNSAPVVDCPDDAAIQIGLNGNLGFICQIYIYIFFYVYIYIHILHIMIVVDHTTITATTNNKIMLMATINSIMTTTTTTTATLSNKKNKRQ